MLTKEWQSFHELRDAYTWNQLDCMYQDGLIECKIEYLYSNGIACGSIHWYRLPQKGYANGQ